MEARKAIIKFRGRSIGGLQCTEAAIGSADIDRRAPIECLADSVGHSLAHGLIAAEVFARPPSQKRALPWPVDLDTWGYVIERRENRSKGPSFVRLIGGLYDQAGSSPLGFAAAQPSDNAEVLSSAGCRNDTVCHYDCGKIIGLPSATDHGPVNARHHGEALDLRPHPNDPALRQTQQQNHCQQRPRCGRRHRASRRCQNQQTAPLVHRLELS